jgi:hypothetical protein
VRKIQTKVGSQKIYQKPIKKVLRMKYNKWKEKFIASLAQILLQNFNTAVKIKKWGKLYGPLKNSQNFNENYRLFITWFKLIQIE